MTSLAFNSFFSSFKNRQSVPWTMSLCGCDLTIPTSCRRKAKNRTLSSGLYSRHFRYATSLSVCSAYSRLCT